MQKLSEQSRDYLTTPEAAERSGLTRVYLALLLRHGTLDGYRQGRDWFVYADSLHSSPHRENQDQEGLVNLPLRKRIVPILKISRIGPLNLYEKSTWEQWEHKNFPELLCNSSESSKSIACK